MRVNGARGQLGLNSTGLGRGSIPTSVLEMSNGLEQFPSWPWYGDRYLVFVRGITFRARADQRSMFEAPCKQ